MVSYMSAGKCISAMGTSSLNLAMTARGTGVGVWRWGQKISWTTKSARLNWAKKLVSNLLSFLG